MGEHGLFEGRTALVTGAARGIGAAVARTLARHGAAGLALVDVDEAAAGRLAQEIGGETGCRCLAIGADVADEAQGVAACRRTRDGFGGLDLLVNNAGICRIVGIDDLTMEAWDRTMDINLKGTFLFSREAMKIMKVQRRGRIVNLASQAGRIGGLTVGADYAASKAGILCLTKSFAKAGAPFGVLVNSVAPGLVDTDMTRTFGYDAATVPLGRIGTAQEVADVVLFLASDLSRYITGACLDVNGGMTMW